MFFLLACILRMWISSTPSPPLEGTALLEPVPHQGPLIPVHQPQQRGALLQETLLHKKLSIWPGVLLGLGKFLLLQLCTLFIGLLLGCPGAPQLWVWGHGPRLGWLHRLPVSYPWRCRYRLKFPQANKMPEVESASPGRVIQSPTKTQELKKESTSTAI